MAHDCGACDGTGDCYNDFHDQDVINDLITDAMGDTCPACGGTTGDRLKCSVCGGTGRQDD
jgi:hypothetical protein